MIWKLPILSGVAVGLLACGIAGLPANAQTQWKPHDRNRPAPKEIDPGTWSSQETAGKAPSDAVVLFDGKDLSAWVSSKGGPAPWKVADGYFEVVPKSGQIQTNQGFGSIQLHLEFREPSPPVGQDQDRGNSGVFLMGLYEIQVLDSYQSKTYPDGQVGAVYGQYPPLVNAARKPGEWQSYDIVFHAPKFSADGKVEKKARVTVIHNGVLIQDDVEIQGTTSTETPEYKNTSAKLPLALQDHNHPVRYRNIWVRQLAD